MNSYSAIEAFSSQVATLGGSENAIKSLARSISPRSTAVKGF
jgi:hypothetical protein